MRIRRIKVRNYAGIDEAEVSFPAHGITIIEGVNESGKTTLIEAVDAILSLPDSSSKREIKEAKPVGRDVGPEVEVDMTAGDFTFTYFKRWLRSKETILTVSEPSHEQLTGRDAHDRVREILAQAVDLELYEALRLEQGKNLQQASFDVSALGRALDTAAGGDVSGDREDVLWDRIEEEYQQYWTAGGKARGDFKSMGDALEAAQEDLDKAIAHLRDLDADTEEIQRLSLAAGALKLVHTETLEDVARLTEKVEAAAKFRHAAEEAQSKLERATLIHQTAQNNLGRREELVKAVATAEEVLAEIMEEISRSAPARQAILSKQQDAQRAQQDARLDLANKLKAQEQARLDSEYRRRQIEVEQLTERRDRVKEAQEQLERAEEILDAALIDDELLAKIEQAHLELVKAADAESRALPIVSVSALKAVRIEINGDDMQMGADDERVITVRDTTSIVVPDALNISVRAGVDNADVVEHLATAKSRYDELCQSAGVDDFADARVQLDAQSAARRDRGDAVDTIERDLRDLTLDALSNKITRINDRVAAYEAEREALPPISPDLTSAQEIERSATQAAEDAKETVERADVVATQASAELMTVDVEGAGLDARLAIAQSTRNSADEMLSAARKVEGDEALRASEEEAAADVEKAVATCSAADKQLAEADPESLDALLLNARAALSRSVTDLQESEGRRKELEIKVGLQTEQGPAKDVADAESSLEEIRVRYNRTQSQAAASELLYRLFSQHRKEARLRYNKPFRDQVERLGRIVYGPTLEVRLNDDLAIESRIIDGELLEFGQLSTGAQEQLGLISRLACATLVAPEGGVPVVFDDALGWTDPGKLDRMGAAISSAADECQIIILTCVPDRYSNVGKARTVTIP